MEKQTRRTFLATTGVATLGIAAGLTTAKDELTIGDVMDKIINKMVGHKLPQTVDTLKCGNPAQKLTGITTTFFATTQVIQQTIAAGNNFIITHEPTFYNHLDETEWLQDSKIFQSKWKLLQDNNIAVWRCHDYIHTMKPDGIVTGMVDALQWQQFAATDSPLFRLPEKTVSELVEELKQKLNIATLRIVGDPNMKMQTAGLMVGAPGGNAQISFAKKYEPDVLICGEIAEWETSEYFRDANLQGRQCALIVLGHIQSEQEGMRFMADWLKELFPQVKIDYIPATSPFRFI